MKKIFVLIAFVLLLACPQKSFAYGGIVSTRQIITTNTSATVPVVLASAGTYASKVTIIGNKTARTANTGTVYIGVTSGNDTQPIAITSGQVVTLEAPPGEWLDLSEWYLDVISVNDGVTMIFTW